MRFAACFMFMPSRKSYGESNDVFYLQLAPKITDLLIKKTNNADATVGVIDHCTRLLDEPNPPQLVDLDFSKAIAKIDKESYLKCW